MSDQEKLVILSFDEVYIAHDICFDKAAQQVLGPHKTVQVVMARGLCKSWKQPIFYSYDTPMTKEILNELISKLLLISGFLVVAVVSDMGTTNMGMWKSMGISYTNSAIIHPSVDRNIHVLADVPHLIKLIRNNYLDHGFVLKTDNGLIYKYALVQYSFIVLFLIWYR